MGEQVFWRRQAIGQLTASPLDLLVVGGGIVGAGVARDAAMRGLRVGLVEQHDFASGTSSRSSRLLHGGLRYLAQGRVGLVRQAGREKRILHRIAPHLAAEMPFIFPTYKGTQWSLGKLRIGVKLYDLLCGTHERGTAGTVAASDALALANIADTNLTGGVRYFDSFTNDARLVMDTLRSAQKHGAILLNYVRLTDAKRAAKGWNCALHDAEDNQDLQCTARTVVNATGPWSQQVPNSRIKLRLTKGVHLVIRHDRLPISDAIVMAQGSRILFAIPWGERVILGTTDTDYTGEVETVTADAGDAKYILDHVNASFPAARITPRDIVGHWAGIRPLIAAGNRKGKPSNISRKHVIRVGEQGWIDVAGGKLTTYRLIAEQVVNRAIRMLERRAVRSRTAEEALVNIEEAEGISSLLPPQVSRNLVEHYCRNEWATHLEDVMVRRTSWQYYVEDPGATAQEVAGWMAGWLHWDHQTWATELATYAKATRAIEF